MYANCFHFNMLLRDFELNLKLFGDPGLCSLVYKVPDVGATVIFIFSTMVCL